MAAAYGVRKLKQYANRKRLQLRRPRRRMRTGVGMQIPTSMGKRMIKIPNNMPRKLKKGLKHCSTLVKKKIELFKDALVKKVNRIYYYRGVYKATEVGKIDNDVVDQLGPAMKSFKNIGTYGGALGFGRDPELYGDVTDLSFNFALNPGNALAICIDMPTGYFLPQSFFSDVRDGAQYYQRRQFGMTPTGQWDQKVITALNDGERTIINALALPVLEDANATNKINYQKIYTLSYRYKFTFKQNSGPEMICWVITFKLGNTKAADFENGLSNFINQQVKADDQGTHARLVRGQLPPCFKVVNRKSCTVKDDVVPDRKHQNIYGTLQKMGTIYLKSNKAYLSCATRPATTNSLDYIDPGSDWYNENIHKYNYVIVYSIPKYLTDYTTSPELNVSTTNEVIPNTVQCIVQKETSYCVLSR